MRTQSSGTETRSAYGASSAEATGPASTGAAVRAPLGPTLALTVTLAAASFVVVLAIVMFATEPKPVPGFDVDENQKAETLLYGLSFAVLLPLALVLVPRLGDRICAGPNAGAFPFLTALLVATLAVSLLISRALPGGGNVVDALITVGVWWVAAIGLLVRLRQGRPWPQTLRAAKAASWMWGLAAASALGVLLLSTSLASISPVALVLAAVAVPALVWACSRRDSVEWPHLPRRWGRLVDASLVVVLVWAIPNLVIFSAGPLGQFNASVIQFHHDLWLGPANEVLAGRPLLVDTAAQYGIAPIYLLAGWFELAPIGYGTLGFLDGVLFALFFAGGYCALRIAGTSRLLAAGALAFGVVVLIYNLPFSVGSLPQHGPLRFGLPMALIVAAAAEARWRNRAQVARAVQFAIVGLASIWSFEALAYTGFTFAAIICFQAWMQPGTGRRAWLARRAALATGACVGANLIFIAATLVFAGEFPDYGWYLEFLHEFFLGSLAELTYDFSPWSPGLAVGIAYAALAAGLILLAQRHRDIVERERVAMVTLCGITAYGVVLFSYFVDRSQDHVLPYVSLPAVLAGALWLSLLLRGALPGSRKERLGGLAFVLTLSALLVAVAWSSVSDRFGQSPLGRVLPGGGTLSAGLDALWHPPPIDPNAPEGERLVDKYMPDESRVTILVSPDLATEILLRSGRSNQLAFSYPLEDSFADSRTIPALGRSVAELESGDRILIQRGGLKAFRVLRAQPPSDGFPEPVPGSSLIPVQEWVLQRIAERFKLRILHRDDQGFVVATLRAR
jgi:hypothetical protein